MNVPSIFTMGPGGLKLDPILPGGGKIRPLLFFLHHPKKAQDIKLNLSEPFCTFKTHFASQTSSLSFKLLPWQQNYRRYLAGFCSKEK